MDRQEVIQDHPNAVIPQLPPEISLTILGHIFQEKTFRNYSERQRTFGKLSKVCWSWRRATIPHLFRKPRLSRLRQVEKFVRCLDDRPEFGQYVRVIIDLDWAHDQGARYGREFQRSLWGQLLGRCPNFEELCLDYAFSPTGMDDIFTRHKFSPYRSRPTELVLQCDQTKCDDFVMRIIAETPLLQSLELRSGRFLAATLLTLIETCPHLTQLILVNVNYHTMKAKIEEARPKHLSIQYVQRDGNGWWREFAPDPFALE
ncbi:hypothetical protein DFS34DRAFT_589080 [Phlyctochytrium arcticum]|nr:hypothetical protein DFS34DRAFT_589080 [Phlyctochytrium arcticum]